MATYTGTSGTDLFNAPANDGVSDDFNFSIANIQSTDRVRGGTGGGHDTLTFTTGGTATGTLLSQVFSQLEEIRLSTLGNKISLNDALASGPDGGSDLQVRTASGDDFVNAASVTRSLSFQIMGGGADTLLGGSGADTFVVSAKIDALDQIDGGSQPLGSIYGDTLRFVTGGTYAANALSGVKGFETVRLDLATSLTITDQMGQTAFGKSILVIGGLGKTVDASALTGDANVRIQIGTGVDKLTGGAGHDLFYETTGGGLGPDDTIVGGGGIDTLRLFDSENVITLASSAKISGIELVRTGAGQTNDLTFAASVAASALDKQVTIVSSGSDRVDASAFKADQKLIVAAEFGDDSLRGGLGQDLFQFDTERLTGADRVAGGAGDDVLELSGSGSLGLDDTFYLRQVEEIRTLGPNIELLLAATVASTATDRTVTIRDDLAGGGGVNVDAGLFTAADRLEVLAGGGAIQVAGGAGADSVQIKASELTSADFIFLGGGADTLLLTGADGPAAPSLANVRGVETVKLSAAGNAIALSDATAASATGGKVAVVGQGAGNDTLDASALTANRSVVVTAAGGADDLTGGLGSDTFSFAANALTSADAVDGGAGGGSDTLAITTAGKIAVDALANVSGIENLTLAAGGNAVTLLNGFATGSENLSLLTVTADVNSTGADIVDLRQLNVAGSTDILIFTYDGDDKVYGGNVDQSADLGGGADLFQISALYLDRVGLTNGDTGSDRLALEFSQNATIDFQDLNFTSFERVSVIETGGAATLEISAIGVSRFQASNQNVFGTSFDDVLIVDSATDGQSTVELASGLVFDSSVTVSGTQFDFFRDTFNGPVVLAVEHGLLG